MTSYVELYRNTTRIDRQIEELEGEISNKKSFCCRSCPNLIQQIGSDLEKMRLDCEKNSDIEVVKATHLKQEFECIQQKWSPVSEKLDEEIPDRCVRNVLTRPTRILNKIRNSLPNFAVLGVGALFSSSARTGCLAGMARFGATISVAYVLKKLKLLSNTEKNSEYHKELIEKNSPTSTGLSAAIIEEVVFRLGLQNIVGLTSSSILFGLAHAINPHKDSKTTVIQVVFATMLGFVCGYLKENYGMEAAIAAHAVNNSLAYILMDLASLKE